MSLPEPTREIMSVIRRFRLSYKSFAKHCHAARKQTGLVPPKAGRKLPKLLPEASLRAFFDAVAKSDNLMHEILFQLLIQTGVRVSELCAIRMADVDLEAGKIFIEQGKGAKDRYVLFGDAFRLPLRAYMEGHQQNEYLFESKMKRAFSPRRIRQIMDEYAEAAGITENVHPHLFRHSALSFLTKEGLSDTQIQLISGHASKKTLEVYQHLSLGDVAPDFQAAMRKRQL